MSELGNGSRAIREENTKVWSTVPVLDSPNTPTKFLRKITGNKAKTKTFRVAILGQDGVGKTAFAVRFLTRRFIGDYDPTLEQIYHCKRVIRDTVVEFAVLDTAGPNTKDHLAETIKWADAFILLYSVSDRCSFIECHRIKFTINTKNTSYLGGNHGNGVPVFLVGNQSDRVWDRMVSETEGRRAAAGMGCHAFYEVSVLETMETVIEIFEQVFLVNLKLKSSKQSRGSTSVPRLEQSKSVSELETESNHCSMPCLRRREDMFSCM